MLRIRCVCTLAIGLACGQAVTLAQSELESRTRDAYSGCLLHEKDFGDVVQFKEHTASPVLPLGGDETRKVAFQQTARLKDNCFCTVSYYLMKSPAKASEAICRHVENVATPSQSFQDTRRFGLTGANDLHVFDRAFGSEGLLFRHVRLVVFVTVSGDEQGDGAKLRDSLARIILNRAAGLPLSHADFRQRNQLRNESSAFDASVKEARRIYSTLDVDLGSDNTIANWRSLVLHPADLQTLQGYTLTHESMPRRDFADDKPRFEQRLNILSGSGESLHALLLYTESSQQAQIQLLDYFANTSMGLGQFLWNLTRIQDGVGETCLIRLVMRFQPNSSALEYPADVEPSDSTVVFFRDGVAVYVVNRGRPDDDRSTKANRSAMDLASQLDDILIRKRSKIDKASQP